MIKALKYYNDPCNIKEELNLNYYFSYFFGGNDATNLAVEMTFDRRFI